MVSLSFTKIKPSILLLIALVAVAGADYSLKVVVKHPYSVESYDSLGNIIIDSLCRQRECKAIIYRIDGTDSLFEAGITNDRGEAIFSFLSWNDGSPVDTAKIGRIDIDFPTTEKVIRIGNEIRFEPLRFENVDLTKGFGEITIVLPMSVSVQYVTIGAGNFFYAFAIMSDMHIAYGKANGDFGSDGYDDYDDNPNETTFAIQNNENVIAKINELIIHQFIPIKFVICLGDITESSEHSEYQRAVKILSNLVDYTIWPPSYWLHRLLYIPIFGNHDTWPYTSAGEMPPDLVTVGGYFYGAYPNHGFVAQYDSLRYFLPVPGWEESPWVAEPTSNSGHEYPSHFFNFSFDYQGRRFICTDWNTRNRAVWPKYGTNGYADVNRQHPWNHTWTWLRDEVAIAKNNKEAITILSHHPLRGPGYSCFSSSEIDDIADAGLRNVKPTPIWFGGHRHDRVYEYRFASDGDTIAYVYSVNDVEYDAEITIVYVCDSVKVDMDITPYTAPLPVTVNFTSQFSYQGSYNAPDGYYWDFGDGYSSSQQNPTHVYHLYDNLDTLFKVSLTVTTQGGRKVSYSKVIPVTASPYSLRTAYLYETELMLVWDFDQHNKVDYYIVKRNGQQIATSTTKFFIDTQNTGLQRGQIYNYEVSVHYKSWVGHADSPAAKLYNVQVPWVDAPTLRQPAEIPPNQVRLSWHNNSIYAQKYIIHRWDDITNQWHYGYYQANSPIETLFVDNVQWPHKYKYVVVARATSASYDTSAWSNTVEYTSGMLAQSNYPRMSAYNNGAKVARFENNI